MSDQSGGVAATYAGIQTAALLRDGAHHVEARGARGDAFVRPRDVRDSRGGMGVGEETKKSKEKGKEKEKRREKEMKIYRSE